LTAESQRLFPGLRTVRQETEWTDALKAGGQDMQQETAG
jgi:hypothetical protein